MSIVSKLISEIRGRREPKPAAALGQDRGTGSCNSNRGVHPERVTAAVKIDVKKNIKTVKEFDESNFGLIYDAAFAIKLQRSAT